MPRLIDLSADVGEGYGSWTMGDDARLLDSLSSANVACGFHAGDPSTMRHTVELCRHRGVAIGAHPSFPDRVGFGRRTMQMSYDELFCDTVYQVGALAGFARAAGVRLQHVSPHGRLGNLVVTDEAYAAPVLDAIAAVDTELAVVTYSGVLERLARDRGMRVGLMGFPDRAYEDDGTLVSRQEPDAVVHETELIAERALRMVETGTIEARSGRTIEINVQTVLLHGDNDASVHAAIHVRRVLEEAGVEIAPLSEVLDA
ncbi:LamB/YcsF family protein [Nocardioides euryhalodurans]|uniref:5-oxoprolinase subunit PxpA n=1 Tax=Nocardioides euryhalodurans TaxID=2518370 RepID=A0A4P7GNB7_9ACTN|nr:5-oxoprolinase subunit PxpA [Nocardioides euryhalodurans]QBR93686.1 5-oxoprolinase subunit PxpA [Nocardioides euryhalodurans]